MVQDVTQKPNKKTAVLYVAELILFVGFVCCVVTLLYDAFDTEKTFVLGRCLSQLPFLQNLDDPSVKKLLLFDLPKTFAQDDHFAVLLRSNIVLGPVVLTQKRRKKVKCSRPSVVPCFVSDSPPAVFEGLQTKLHFPYDASRDAFVISLYNSTIAEFNVAWNSTIVDDFIDDETQSLEIQFVVMNPEYEMLVETAIRYNFPISGGQRHSTHFSYCPLAVTLLSFGSIYVWCYCACWIMLNLSRLWNGWKGRKTCLCCLTRTKQVLSSSCWKCSRPITLAHGQVVKCRFCQISNPAVYHSCWRAHLTQWNFISLLCFTLFAAAFSCYRVMLSEVTKQMRDLSAQTNFQAAFLMFSWVKSLGAVCIVLSFILLYRHLSAMEWSARFQRVFSTGGLLILFFFFAFFSVFFGFTLAFHLLLCEASETFATTFSSLVGTFQAFLGFLDWEVVSADSRKWVFSWLYVCFSWLCLLTMLNVLVALVTVEYKRTTKVLYFSHEMESLRLLLYPIYAYFHSLKQRAVGSRTMEHNLGQENTEAQNDYNSSFQLTRNKGQQVRQDVLSLVHESTAQLAVLRQELEVSASFATSSI